MLALLVILATVATGTNRPDEGQWLPEQFLGLDWKALEGRGLKLSKEQFWHPTEGGVLSAAVQISGCSASFVSEDGLIVTNHHCAFGAIQQISSVERDFVRDGFAAATRDDELTASGIQVFILRRFEDVTARIQAAVAKAEGDLARFTIAEEERAKIAAETHAKEKDATCEVQSFLSGSKYILYVRTRIPDVRLVYAPPRSVGEFGGEDDNWMWPRHTGDFSFLRAYVGKDGSPKPYSKDNVPYRPKHWLKTAKSGVKDGDLVMVLGYPGRTERYLSSVSVKSREEDLYPLRYRILTRFLGILESAGKTDARTALQLSTQVKSLANVQKNALGMTKGLVRNAVLSRKLGEEEAFTAWVKADPARSARYGTVLEDLRALDREDTASARRDEILNGIVRQCPLVGALAQAMTAAEQNKLAVEARDANWRGKEVDAALTRASSKAVTTMLPLIEQPALRIFFEEALALPAGQRWATIDALRTNSEDGPALADLILGASAMKETEARAEVFKDGGAAALASDDPLLRLARGLAGDLRELRTRLRRIAGRRLVVGSLWIAAQQEWRGATFYPDANSTLRVSVATIKGYQPRDGIQSLSRTMLRGVIEKETGNDPFASPTALLEAARAKDQGRFVDPALGDVPVCFLADGDTTGGNSGSPIINGAGELVGLNFDRVFENVVGDFGWSAERSRNVGVDIRYVLWNLERVLKAPALLTELGY